MLQSKISVLAAYLNAHQQKLATAESCTGGGLAYALTAVPGSSAWFEQGWVTYSNGAKTRELGVDKALLQRVGAVSAEVAEAMTIGVLMQSPVDYAISITGIAGPDGGSADKPVGLVWFGFAQKGAQAWTVSQQFGGDRTAIREQAIRFAVETWITQYISP